eukprot:4720348-Amphidinium_carterae.1
MKYINWSATTGRTGANLHEGFRVLWHIAHSFLTRAPLQQTVRGWKRLNWVAPLASMRVATMEPEEAEKL